MRSTWSNTCASRHAVAELRVAAGVLVDADGRVLLASRPPGKQLAGHWEFPGGKLEPGETSVEALRRELHEELAIDAGAIDAETLIEVPWRHDATHLRLIVHRVRVWRGEPQACEGQDLAWRDPASVESETLAPADRHILHALRLPATYAVTPDLAAGTAPHVVEDRLQAMVRQGHKLLQLRLPALAPDAVRKLAHEYLPALREAGVSILLNGDVEGALQLNTGVHLRASQLTGFSERPLPQDRWVGASCHGLAELRQAAGIGVDFAVLSPVRPTRTHPGAAHLGWEHFAALVRQTPLPVYAMGGMTPADVQRARQAGAQGVAGIRAFCAS